MRFEKGVVATMLSPSAPFWRAALAGLCLCACSDPFRLDTQRVVVSSASQEEVCPASSEWLPTTPELALFKPLPHPATECPFYRGAWQTFMLATQPDPDSGEPAFKSYPTIDNLFEREKPHGPNYSWLGDVKQPGGRQILIDQNGHAIYYGIHVNHAFAQFVADNGLRTADAIRNADPNLFFPAGVAEFKSAWQEMDPHAADADTYIVTKATVPQLSQRDGQIVEDREQPREVTVRLLALHVVFTLPGHPEFIWATFEHTLGAPDITAEDGRRNLAPTPADNPPASDPNNQNDSDVISAHDSLLYRGGTPANQANIAIADGELQLDEPSQSFPGQQTSIYRLFPAAKSNTTDPDDAVTSLNFNVQTLFQRAQDAGQLDPNDRRGYYRLVGAVWLDKPQYFANDSTLENDDSSPLAKQPNFAKDLMENGSDSELSILGGEDRLSSVALESFTQAPDSFPNCFACHNTQAVTAKGVPLDHDSQGTELLSARLLNVSHVFSQFLLEEQQGP